MQQIWKQADFFIGEEDFIAQMETEVGPFLKRELTEGFFKSFDGTNIHYAYLKTASEKGAIVISHGFCEFCGKYHELMYYFYKLGYSVFYMDHRGHGYSDRALEDRDKVYVTSFDDYVEDLHNYLENIVKKESASGQLFLFAHSMGGAVGALYLEKYPQDFKKAVLSSPMIEMKCGNFPTIMVRWLLLISKLMHWQENYAPGQHGFDHVNKFENSSAKSRPRYDYVFNLREEDWHYQTYGSTYSWVNAGLKTKSSILKNTANIKTPVLLCQAGRDAMVLPEAQRRFVEQTPGTVFKSFPNSKHEIFNADREIREEYYNDVFEFIEEQ